MALLSTLGTALLLGSVLTSSPQQAAPAASPQEAEPDGTAQGDLGWAPKTDLERRLLDQYGDFNVAVVGEEIITRFDMFSWLAGPRFKDPTLGRTDLKDGQKRYLQAQAALTQLIEQRLKIQGGRSQGYEPELIAAERERYFRIKLEEMGGTQAAAAAFEREGITPEEYKNLLGEGLMANLWERSITGMSPGATGRPFVDAYVRPGKQWARYREYSESRNQELNAVVGLTRNGKLTVQRLVLIVNPRGEPADVVKAKMETLREKIAADVLTFDEGIQQFAAPSMQGKESIVRDARPEALVQLFEQDFSRQSAEVKAFFLEADAGELSPVFEFDAGGTPQAYILFKITARTKSSPALAFESLELQQRLTAAIRKESSEVRVSRGLAELVRTTHLAPEELRTSFLARGRRRKSE